MKINILGNLGYGNKINHTGKITLGYDPVWLYFIVLYLPGELEKDIPFSHRIRQYIIIIYII